MIYEPESWDEVRILLDLADNRRDVQTTTVTPRTAVVIPEELYQRFLTYKSLHSSPPREPKKTRSKA